jgi:hypothetical protein
MKVIHGRTTATGWIAIAVLAAGCVDAVTVAQDDAEPDVSADGRDEADVADAPADEFTFIDADVPPDGPPAIWANEHCGSAQVIEEGRTGDPCSMTGSCAMIGEHSTTAWCDPEGHLVIAESSCRLCTDAPADPWADCAAALVGGASGQRCSGEWACLAVDPEDRCCAETADCGRGGSRYWPTDRLVRTRLCLRDCPSEPFAERPVRTGCPGPRSPFDPEPLLGDGCSGEWGCMAEDEAFAASPTGCFSPVPVWCAGGVMQLSPTYVCGEGSRECDPEPAP